MSVNQSQERRHCEQGQQGNKSKQGKVGKQGTLWVQAASIRTAPRSVCVCVLKGMF